MSLDFRKIEAENIAALTPFYGLRPNKTCDSVILDSFLWREYYQVQYAISDGKAIQWLMQENGVMHSAMPVCSEADLPHYFDEMVTYFNQVLRRPFKIYLADEEAVEHLKLKQNPHFEVKEQEDLKDYLYDGEALRTLSGKKLHKKKNNLNNFLKSYEGSFEYRKLNCENRYEVWELLDNWRTLKGQDVENHMDYEVEGIHELLRNCGELAIRMGGIYIDGKLQAFTIGSYNAFENMAIIHIEKANPEIRGLYQYINQQFLIHEFPDVPLVNREDDLGIEGLRKAKMSYNPCGFARKYLIKQLNFKPLA